MISAEYQTVTHINERTQIKMIAVTLYLENKLSLQPQ
jgi:hypothetical protein